MSLAALDWAFNLPLIGAWKGVLVALAHHADKDGKCRPGIDRLALFAGLDHRSVQRCLRYLEELKDDEGRKAITVTCSRGGRRASDYKLNLDFVLPAGASPTGPDWKQKPGNGHDTPTHGQGIYPDTQSPLSTNTLTQGHPNGTEYHDPESSHPRPRVTPALTQGHPNYHRKVIEREKGSERAQAPAPAPAPAPIPEDWQPNAESERYAAERGVPLAPNVRKFRNNHLSKRTVLADWQARFRMWCDEEERRIAERDAAADTRRNGFIVTTEQEGWVSARRNSHDREADAGAKVIEGIFGHA